MKAGGEGDNGGWDGGMTYQLNGHEFEQTLGDGDGQGSLVCCSPQGHKESVTTEWLNNNKMESIKRLAVARRWEGGDENE